MLSSQFRIFCSLCGTNREFLLPPAELGALLVETTRGMPSLPAAGERMEKRDERVEADAVLGFLAGSSSAFSCLVGRDVKQPISSQVDVMSVC